MNRIHKANRKAWDAISQEWQERVDAEGKWRRCHVEPSLALRQQELEHLGDVSGKKVCVLGSGDNLIVFALAGLGARVRKPLIGCYRPRNIEELKPPMARESRWGATLRVTASI